MTDEKVDHPSHYNTGKIEVIDFIEDQKLGFHEGNVVKYVARAKHKGTELEDLRKAAWYLNRAIEQLSSVVFHRKTLKGPNLSVVSSWCDEPGGQLTLHNNDITCPKCMLLLEQADKPAWTIPVCHYVELPGVLPTRALCGREIKSFDEASPDPATAAITCEVCQQLLRDRSKHGVQTIHIQCALGQAICGTPLHEPLVDDPMAATCIECKHIYNESILRTAGGLDRKFHK